MNNPDFIIIILLCILIFSLFHSNKELFDLQAQYKNLYPIFSPSSDVNSAKSNLNNSQLQIFNNILQKVKNKINKSKTKNPYKIDYLDATKKTRKLPEATKIAKTITKHFNKINKRHIVELIKVSPSYAELHNNNVSLTFDIYFDYTIKGNKSYYKSGFQKNTYENHILVRCFVFFPLEPKPNLSKMFIQKLQSKELSNKKYLPGDGNENNYPFKKSLTNKIVMNKKEIAKLLSGRETKSIEDRLKKARRKKLLKDKNKVSLIHQFLLNSPKAKKNKKPKKENFMNKSLSETILNPPTDDINDYFSFME